MQEQTEDKIQEERLVNVSNIKLPDRGGSKIVHSMKQINDDLSGVNFEWLLRSTAAIEEPEQTKGKCDKGYFTFLFGEYSAKGPYRSSTSAIPSELQLLLFKYKILRTLSLQNVILPLCVLLDPKGNFFLIFDNAYRNISLVLSLKIHDTGRYYLARRNVIVPLSEELNNEELMKKAKGFSKNLLLSLCILYSLGVGNISPLTIFIDRRIGNFYIFDIDCRREFLSETDTGDKKKMKEYFYFDSRVKLTNLHLWDRLIIDDIRKVIEDIHALSLNLSSYEFTEEMITRLRIAYETLIFFDELQEKQSRKTGNEIGMTEIIAESAPVSKPFHTIYSLDEKILDSYKGDIDDLDIFTMRKEKEKETTFHRYTTTPQYAYIEYSKKEDKVFKTPTNYEDILKTLPEGISDIIASLEIKDTQRQIEARDIGKMKIVRGATGRTISESSVTYSGYTMSEMKYRIQECIRKGIRDKAMMCALELWRMKEIGTNQGALILVKKLAQCAIEHVGVANIDLVYTTVSYCYVWYKELIKEKYKGVNILQILFLVSVLSTSEKSHLAKYIWYSYTLNKEISNSFNVPVYNAEEYEYFASQIVKPSEKYFLKGDPEELRKLGDLFITFLADFNPNCIVWLNYYFYLTQPKGDFKGLKMVKRASRSNPMYIIFDIFADFFKISKETIEPFTFFFFEDSEFKRIVLEYLVTSYLMYQDIGLFSGISNKLIEELEINKLDLEKYDLKFESGKKKSIDPIELEQLSYNKMFEQYSVYYNIFKTGLY